MSVSLQGSPRRRRKFNRNSDGRDQKIMHEGFYYRLNTGGWEDDVTGARKWKDEMEEQKNQEIAERFFDHVNGF
jgi:hypothetical protein